MALDQGLEIEEPPWLDRPAVSQVTISTPGYWHLFDIWNQGRSFAEGVKPFGFMLVAYADPLRSSQVVGRLVHPYERDPARWIASEWADLHEPGKRYRIRVRQAQDQIGRPGDVLVKTYRDVLNSYLGHPESKSTGRDGEVCERWTKGRLGRRAIHAAVVMHIGKEANRLEDRLIGLVDSEDDFLLKLGDDGSWSRLVIPVMRTLETRLVIQESGIASSTYADIVTSRTRPQKRHEVKLRRIAHSRAGDWLNHRRIHAPSDPASRLALYLERRQTWEEQVAIEYKAALAELAALATHQHGIIDRIQKTSGVSRRRLRSVKDPVLRERIIEAIRTAIRSL